MTLSTTLFTQPSTSKQTQQHQRRTKKADDEADVTEVKVSEDEILAEKKKKALADLSADLQKLDELVIL
jgi:gas vesicle protein